MNRILPKLDSKQFGAIRGRSTTHALVDMLHIWHKAIDQSQLARVMFVDFSKALPLIISLNLPSLDQMSSGLHLSSQVDSKE